MGAPRLKGCLGCWGLPWVLACGVGPNPDPNGPRIKEVAYFQQVPTQPLNLEFGLRFSDADGDLGAGDLVFSIDGVAQPEVGVSRLFGAQEPPLPLDAREGWLEFEVRLQGELSPGDEFELAFVLTDGASRRSNRQTLVLRVVGPQQGLGNGG